MSVSVLVDPESQSKYQYQYQYQLHCQDQDQDSSYLSLNSVQRCIPPFCSTSFSSSSSSTSLSANTTQLSLTSSLNSLVINSDIAASRSLPSRRSPSPLTSGTNDGINIEVEREEEEGEGEEGGGISKRRKQHNSNDAYLDLRKIKNSEHNEFEKYVKSSSWKDDLSKDQDKDQLFQTKSITRSHQKEMEISEKFISLPPARYGTSTYSAKKSNNNNNNDNSNHSAVTSRSRLRSKVLAPTSILDVRKQIGLKNVPNTATQRADTSKFDVCCGADWSAITASITTSSCDTTLNSSSISSYSSSKRTRSRAVLMPVNAANLE